MEEAKWYFAVVLALVVLAVLGFYGFTGVLRVLLVVYLMVVLTLLVVLVRLREYLVPARSEPEELEEEEGGGKVVEIVIGPEKSEEMMEGFWVGSLVGHQGPQHYGPPPAGHGEDQGPDTGLCVRYGSRKKGGGLGE